MEWEHVRAATFLGIKFVKCVVYCTFGNTPRSRIWTKCQTFLRWTLFDLFPAVKAVAHFHPNLPLFDWHQRWWRKCGNVSKTSKPSSGSNALPPPFNMWKEAAFQRNKKHKAGFIVASMLQLSPFAWLWNILGIPSESRLDSQTLAGAWIHRTSWEEKPMKPKRCIG